jgi:hypothetical protein
MTERLNGPRFMERCFGEESAAVSAALVAAGQAAHSRALNAKEASELETNHAYGATFWVALAEEVATRLAPLLPGCELLEPSGSQYDLLLWNGSAILPIKVERKAAAGPLRARWSLLRQRLMGVNPPAERLATLFDGMELETLEPEDEGLAIVTRARRALGDQATAMVVAAFVCSATGGMRYIEVGLATLASDGEVVFSESQPLSIMTTVSPAAAQDVVSAPAFDAGASPKPSIGLVESVATATGETTVQPIDDEMLPARVDPGWDDEGRK